MENLKKKKRNTFVKESVISIFFMPQFVCGVFLSTCDHSWKEAEAKAELTQQ